MSIDELQSLLPLLVLAGAIVIALLGAAWSRGPRLTFGITLLGLVGSFTAIFFRGQNGPVPLLAMDSYSAYYMGLIFASAFALVVFSWEYFQTKNQESSSEYFIVLLLATLGSAVLVASTNFVSLFLGIEILSVSLYVLIAYLRPVSGRPEKDSGLEASLKYLVLAGTASSFLVFGMALIYASRGSLEFSVLPTPLDTLGLLGVAMLLAGIGFKLSLAPFHMWSPDVFEGSAAPVTGFIATISKGAMFALLLRLVWVAKWAESGPTATILGFLAIASMFTGNLAALRQENLKRLLAYSSIAHLGYLLVALLAGGRIGMEAAAFYLVVYFITTLIIFGILSVLSDPLDGLFWQRPWISLVFAAAFLSLAGLPLTAGFIGKFFIASAAVDHTHWALVVILVLNSAIGIYYYFRVIAKMFASPELRETTSISIPSRSALAVLGVLLIVLGVYPTPMLHLIRNAMNFPH